MKLSHYLGFYAFGGAAATITQQDANAAFFTLQQWYNESIGLWIPSTGWWNSANCLTTIADLAKIDEVVAVSSIPIYFNTLIRAQQYNLQMEKQAPGPSNGWMMQTWYGNMWPYFPHGWPLPPIINPDGFLDGYYDDQGWWTLAWIAVYDVTGNELFLQTAETIFANTSAAYGTTPCGGLWWDKKHTYVNAIANELFLASAAALANRVGAGSKEYYLNYALEEWTWFSHSGMINAQNTINDGLNDTNCENNGGIVWSYNQGVILGGLVELSKATGNEQYIAEAKLIANAAIQHLTTNGILHDVCEPNCGADGSQFKGVFARNLQILQEALGSSPEPEYAQFLQVNANSIWANDREDGNELSVVWSGPFVSPANASTQSSAMDAIVGALAVG